MAETDRPQEISASNGDTHGVANDDNAPEPSANQGVTIPTKSKNKRKGKKSLAQRGPTALPANRGSGFEEYFADPPLTPDEAREERDEIYGQHIPFEERIQSCITRFRARRRMTPDHSTYFNEYLFLGGVDTQQAAFSGQDLRELKHLTPAERRDATAHDFVHTGTAGGTRFYNGDEEHWSVNFSCVVAGFLSVSMPRLTSLQKGQMDKAVGVVDNFLRYVLQHDVCPEYEDDVKKALSICAAARKESTAIDELSNMLPGQFNLAGAQWFCDSTRDFFAEHGLARPPKFHGFLEFHNALSLVEPRKLDHLAFGEEKDGKEAPRVTKEVSCTVEFKTIQRATADTKLLFESANRRYGDRCNTLHPLGRAVVVPTIVPDGWCTLDSPPHNMGESEIPLFIEDDILALVKPGMKMDMVLCEIEEGGELGLWIIKTAGKLLPTYFTFLPQELMRDFKPLRDHDKPAPSVHNPDDGNEPAPHDE